MKRANNTGTVYKLGGARRNPWIAKIPQGYTDDGDRVWYTVGYFRTKTDAVNALDAARVKPLPERPNITLGEVFDEWKKTAFVDLSEKTKEMYNLSFKYLKPLHNLKMSTLRTAHFQDIIKKTNLSHSTLQKIKVLSKQLCDYAVLNDVISKNYAQGIKLPKQAKTEKEIFTDAEIKKLFDNDDMPWVDSILILIYTGFRIQELFNITKFDVDLKNKTIRGGLKTEAGTNRIVPIHPKILKYIERRYFSCKNFLFETENGSNDVANYRRRQYKKILETLNIPYHTPHCCRHTCATLLARDGADTLAIKQILGHSSYSFTADTYTHNDIDFLKTEISKMR